MIIEVFEANLEKHDVAHLKPRVGVRAILKHGDQYVLIYHDAWNLYTLPGGGVEQKETLKEALVREVKEETGYSIVHLEKSLTLIEYFTDSIWEHHFYTCETSGQQTALSLTAEEQDAGHRVVHKSYFEILDIFSHHDTLHHNGDAIVQREFLGFIHSL